MVSINLFGAIYISHMEFCDIPAIVTPTSPETTTTKKKHCLYIARQSTTFILVVFMVNLGGLLCMQLTFKVRM